MHRAASSLACPLIALWLGGAVRAQTTSSQSPMEVTTDTPEYCEHLADRAHDLARVASVRPSREVSDLEHEGQKMCAKGQTRGGIMRLRLAITMMMHGEEQPNR